MNFFEIPSQRLCLRKTEGACPQALPGVTVSGSVNVICYLKSYQRTKNVPPASLRVVIVINSQNAFNQ